MSQQGSSTDQQKIDGTRTPVRDAPIPNQGINPPATTVKPKQDSNQKPPQPKDIPSDITP